jgi:hypothetical protein
MYLATVIDVCSRRVVGWATADHMRSELVCDALRMAIGQRRPGPGPIFHSDRGSQYTSSEFTALLEQNDIRQSLSRPGQCWDNAVVESFSRPSSASSSICTRCRHAHGSAVRSSNTSRDGSTVAVGTRRLATSVPRSSSFATTQRKRRAGRVIARSPVHPASKEALSVALRACFSGHPRRFIVFRRSSESRPFVLAALRALRLDTSSSAERCLHRGGRRILV